MEWTTTQIQRLRALWTEGHSTAEIGRRLGVSKNGVIGKARRIGLAARKSPIIRQRQPEPFVPPPASIPRVHALPDRRFSPQEDATILRFPDAAPRWLACILVDRNPAQIWQRRNKLQERERLEARLPPVSSRPVRQVPPKPVAAPPPPKPPAPKLALPRTRGQCQWLHGNCAPYRQCDNPAILLRADGSVCPEGAVWCREHRAAVYCRTREIAA